MLASSFSSIILATQLREYFVEFVHPSSNSSKPPRYLASGIAAQAFARSSTSAMRRFAAIPCCKPPSHTTLPLSLPVVVFSFSDTISFNFVISLPHCWLALSQSISLLSPCQFIMCPPPSGLCQSILVWGNQAKLLYPLCLRWN